jgi:chromosome condensin MukBEF MukE localization factor
MLIYSDLEALDEFRKKGKFGDFPIDDESTVAGDGDGDGTAVTDHDSSGDDDDETRSSVHRNRRMSIASSVSSIHSRMSQLSPVLEEGARAGGGGDTIKAAKRQKKLSTEEMAIEEANEEESDSSDNTMD